MTIFLWVGGGLVLILLLVGVVVSIQSERSLVEKRLGKYLDEEGEPGEGKGATSSALTEWVNKRVERSTFGERISKQLAQADLKFKPGEYMALFVIAIVGVGLIAWLIGGRDLISAIIGGIVGAFLPRMYVRRQQRKRLIRFSEQLPDMINLMVNGLRAGFSTMQAMEAVSKELPSPICDEFRRVVQEMQLGIPMERALANLLRRIPSDDLDFVVTAINVQREVGGNLAEILDVISFTIRERVRIKGEIRVMTSQVMTSGKILSFMPVALLGVLWFVNKGYLLEFFKPEIGWCGYGALGCSASLIG
ncbi:MAG: secretion system protein, partial [Chloroflexi bacterium]|nr:secretion system protein [Chloroflexota bacterium]